MPDPALPPDRERLMHLLDRAERRVLTPAEARLLRGAVTGLLEVPSGSPMADLRDPRRPYGRKTSLTGRQGAVRGVLLAWAEEWAPDVPAAAVDALARVLAAFLPSAPVPGSSLTSKPRVSADDARAIARRLEAGFAGGEER